jgi:D-alanyl-lipoteichoic acid acyltransferase DltB (MBOAT superfamily)
LYFNSLYFVAFFAVVMLAVFALRRIVWARNLFLLAASYFFYACWDWRFLGLILISTAVDYLCGRYLGVGRPGPQGERAKPRRKLVLVASLVTNLGLLGFFKYYDFFIASAIEALAAIGVEAHPTTLRVVLPVGISFYTFQTLSYTIDVYRGRLPTERNLLNFALFVAFFPQLVAGPIERASHLLPQIRERRPMSLDRLYTGFWLICSGMFKKVVIADNAARVVEMVFADELPEGLMVLVGVYAFAIQIYCDFSGYTDIARGTARCLGFDLMLNFNLPYFAANPSAFWRRWHISLSTWLRDYLYIPLGGNQKGGRRTYFNLMATMTLGGLWHGAGWTFVLWGVYHGFLLCLHRALQPFLQRYLSPRGRVAGPVWKLLRVVVLFHLVCYGWLLFRAESMGQVRVFTMRLLATSGDGLSALLASDQTLLFAGLALLLLVYQAAQARAGDLDLIFRLPTPVRATVYAGMALAFMWLGVYGGPAFIYFQF